MLRRPFRMRPPWSESRQTGKNGLSPGRGHGTLLHERAGYIAPSSSRWPLWLGAGVVLVAVGGYGFLRRR